MSAIGALSKLLIKEIFRKKDFYVALILIGVILFYASSLNFYHVGNAVRYLMEIGLMLIYLFSVILTVSLAARQYPSEIQNRTCQVLLAKPLSRFEFVAGKFIGSFLAGAASFLIFYLIFLGVTWHKAETPQLFDMAAPSHGGALSWILAFQAAYLFLLNLWVIASMASGFSYYLTTSANVSISLVLYVLINTYGPGLNSVGAQHAVPVLFQIMAKIFYYFLPHFEFFDLRQRFIHAWEPVSGGLLLFLTAYALVYAFIFLILGWMKLEKTSL